MKFTKDMIGGVIYAIPTGNNITRTTYGETVEFVLNGVGRKYITLERYGRDDKYCPIKGATQSEINSGYSGYSNNAGWIFFPSLEAVTEYKGREKLINQMTNKLLYPSLWLRDMETEDIEVIKSLLIKNNILGE